MSDEEQAWSTPLTVDKITYTLVAETDGELAERLAVARWHDQSRFYRSDSVLLMKPRSAAALAVMATSFEHRAKLYRAAAKAALHHDSQMKATP